MDTQPRDIVFVSHATPENNTFAAWLAAKLQLHGYRAWCDVNDLLGGEDFWNEIESTIRNRTVKFVFVVSRESVSKRGTMKELAVADRIAPQFHEFVIPIMIDDIPFGSLPSEIIRLNAIDFTQNWAEGLNKLLLKLNREDVPHSANAESDASRLLWEKAQLVRIDKLLERDETYQSNWFACIPPAKLRVFQVEDRLQARHFDRKSFPYPVIFDGEYVLTFASIGAFDGTLRVKHVSEVDTLEFINKGSYRYPNSDRAVDQPNHRCIELLNESFVKLMKLRKLRILDPTNGHVWYFAPLSARELKVNLSNYGRRSIQLTGHFKGNRWHLALEAAAFLYPTTALAVTYHIVFSKNNQLLDNSRQITLRRGFGKNKFNKQWRDLVLGAILQLRSSEDATSIMMPASDDQLLCMDVRPLQFTSPVGYKEPRSEDE